MSEGVSILFRTSKRDKRLVREMSEALALEGLAESANSSWYIRRAIRNQLNADAHLLELYEPESE